MSTALPTLKIKKILEDAIIPQKAHPTDSGFDLFACRFEKTFYTHELTEEVRILYPTDDTMWLMPHARVLINTGISATVGPGYEIQIRPRSGLALKQGLTVLNTPGTIDESYRNFIGVILINQSGSSYGIKKGDRIAQMVVCPVALCEVEIVSELDKTDRNMGGFGSTGVTKNE